MCLLPLRCFLLLCKSSYPHHVTRAGLDTHSLTMASIAFDPKSIKRIGVMTCGGDCPGLNAVIRGVVYTAIRTYGWTVLGIEDSMCGLIDLNYRGPFGNMELTLEKVDDILNKGGTILGCSNKSDPFRFPQKQADGSTKEIDVSKKVIENYKTLGLDAIVVIGGDGSMRIAHRLSELSNGAFKVVGAPKTIDNDLIGTEYTFGFNTAVQTIAEAIDKIQDTARSHDRVIIVEVMGRDSGWLALHGGVAGRADVICIPEIPYETECILAQIKKRYRRGIPFCVIVIAEGAKPKGGGVSCEQKKAGEMKRYSGAGHQLAEELGEADEELDVRVSVLGYIQRGGAPSAFDRNLGTRFGVAAARLIAEGKFEHLTALQHDNIVAVPFKDVSGGQKFVDPESDFVRMAKSIDICFADSSCAQDK